MYSAWHVSSIQKYSLNVGMKCDAASLVTCWKQISSGFCELLLQRLSIISSKQHIPNSSVVLKQKCKENWKEEVVCRVFFNYHSLANQAKIIGIQHPDYFRSFHQPGDKTHILFRVLNLMVLKFQKGIFFWLLCMLVYLLFYINLIVSGSILLSIEETVP